ncbi:MAG: hypothetical protein ACOYWZ_22815 [Bacillota bacterium]
MKAIIDVKEVNIYDQNEDLYKSIGRTRYCLIFFITIIFITGFNNYVERIILKDLKPDEVIKNSINKEINQFIDNNLLSGDLSKEVAESAKEYLNLTRASL